MIGTQLRRQQQQQQQQTVAALQLLQLHRQNVDMRSLVLLPLFG